MKRLLKWLRPEMTPTPVTERGLRKFDHLPPHEAIKRAWNDAGPHPQYHKAMQREVRSAMPLLAKALDRAS